MKFLIVAAKTGGHVFPAATVSKKLINNDHQIILIGTGNKIEINAYEDLNSKQYKLNIDGFRGKNVFIKMFDMKNYLPPHNKIFFKFTIYTS